MNKIQYTIRNIPPAVDKVIRNRAKRKGKSFNSTVIDALTLQTLGGIHIDEAHQEIFNRLQGANTLDKEFDRAIKDQSNIDNSLWR